MFAVIFDCTNIVATTVHLFSIQAGSMLVQWIYNTVAYVYICMVWVKASRTQDVQTLVIQCGFNSDKSIVGME